MINVEKLVEHIATFVRGGDTPLQAYKSLLEFGIDESAGKEALAKFEEQTGRIRTLKEPASLIEKGLPSWYPGPSDQDKFWPPLRKMLFERGWKPEAIESIDKASTKVLSLLPPPGLGTFSTRGLVLGYVQSGKTANFSAVISKAADVNYKFIVVLSGITNNLRAQTQRRLQKELVGLNGQDWVELTTIEADFSPGSAGNVNAFLTDHHNQKVLCVVKKNATVLRRLLKWLKSASPQVINNCPVLIIDDEADQASVNASGSDDKRTAINKLLLQMLKSLPKVAYVGYTATPFANIFIDPSLEDLYPRDFIIDLPKPVEYFGPERIFGRERLTNEDSEVDIDGLNMIRKVEDAEIPFLKPSGASTRLEFFPELTDSLKTALCYFWLATAARFARGQYNAHSTMLVHTTLYTDVHEKFRPLFESYGARLRTGIAENDSTILIALSSLWESEQQLVLAERLSETPTSFDQLLPHLDRVLAASDVIIENSRSSLRLFYDDNNPSIQIVVGGNTLSRGLTLEGLIVSYFIRTSTAYDTLLQMGRWFGYRVGYSDLPRIWMTDELKKYFFDLATVEQEMRLDVLRYELQSLTPLEFAVRIRTHPKLTITSKLKMQAAILCDVSFSGRRVQTIVFSHKDKSWLTANQVATHNLIVNAVSAGCSPRPGDKDNIVIKNVPVTLVTSFLAAYQFHPNNDELKTDLINNYIAEQNKHGSLKTWNIAIISRKQKENDRLIELAPGISVPLLIRSKFSGDASLANLKAIMSEIDRVADLDIPISNLKGKSGAELQGLRPEGIGLLLIYPIDRVSKPVENTKSREPLDAIEDVIGLGLVFPETNNPTPLKYMSVDLSKVEREIEPDFIDEEARNDDAGEAEA